MNNWKLNYINSMYKSIKYKIYRNREIKVDINKEICHVHNLENSILLRCGFSNLLLDSIHSEPKCQQVLFL